MWKRRVESAAKKAKALAAQIEKMLLDLEKLPDHRLDLDLCDDLGWALDKITDAREALEVRAQSIR